MKTENTFLLELIDLIHADGINESVCEFIFNETALVSGGNRVPMIQMSKDSIDICNGIYGMLIGEITMGYSISKIDCEKTIDEITDYILITQKG